MKVTKLLKIFFGLLIFALGNTSGMLISGVMNEPRASNPTKGIYPINHIVIERSCYSFGYDFRTKNAAWVYECLSKEGLKGDVKRGGYRFKEDPLIPETFRTCDSDYRGAGFDRGHLAPAANHKSSFEEMEETFYFSNVCPQSPKFNRGYWAKLERQVRDLTYAYKKVEVFTGSLYLPKIVADGTKWVSYQVIGENDIAVPTHFFKLIFAESDETHNVEAYILPNEPISSTEPLDKFKTTLEKVERLSGILFSSFKT